jgi:hypothetical protein
MDRLPGQFGHAHDDLQRDVRIEFAAVPHHICRPFRRKRSKPSWIGAQQAVGAAQSSGATKNSTYSLTGPSCTRMCYSLNSVTESALSSRPAAKSSWRITKLPE